MPTFTIEENTEAGPTDYRFIGKVDGRPSIRISNEFISLYNDYSDVQKDHLHHLYYGILENNFGVIIDQSVKDDIRDIIFATIEAAGT